MLASFSRSAALRQAGLVCRRHVARSASTAAVAPEHDVLEGSDADIDAKFASLNLPDGFPIIKPVDGGFQLSTTHDQNEFQEYATNHAVYHELDGENINRSPYQDALGIDYRKKLTLGTYFVLTALSKEWYIMNEETVIAACFGGFVTAMYMMLAEPLANWYNSKKAAQIKEHNDAEDAHIAACKNILYGFPADAIHKDLDAVFTEEKKAIESEARARVIQERNDVIKSFDNKLNKMVITKQDEAHKAYQILLDDTVAKVQEAAGDAAFKKKALKYAMDAAIGRKVGESPTLDLYNKVFKELGGK